MNDRTPPRARAARPVRPAPRPPARVFWIRRFVVLGLPLLLVVALVVWWTGRGQDAAAQGDPSPTAEQAAPTPTPTSQVGVADCVPSQLALAVVPDGESFADGVAPTFEISLTNSGSEPCLVEAGDAAREVVVTSGDDRVWSSRDCVPEDADARTLLLAGGQSDVTQLAWPRERSAAGCPGDLPAPGDGTYSVTVSAGGATSPAAVFGLG
ncbi:conserved hypothetical protein [Cellulomonas flavigena DSM 20109]|uniref:DUF4232 domain-containing protein n=1 Tax=Cellulomonas flavigena (strain ATCC 482 / DSM 20109 / BCRC 11376 / JCM 18109 / NBRC 3775 / NCIMB 8073 / NRS 134) TaxID=446466 RepID=D5UIH7_CELFN|nr:hypothetical protein [Cellulomonas flavigena]ADG73476.1 conserved hypothetical protein [Cellulomonas flavigena DSM 20109]